MEHLKTLDEFREKVEKSDKRVVIDFHATWCGPCRQVAPDFEKLSQSHPDFVYYKVDVDEAPDLAAHFEIHSIPTFIIFSGKQLQAAIKGAKIQDVIEKMESLPA